MLRDEEIQRIAEECDGDECDQSQTTRFARAVERAAYERAAQECDPHEDDDRIDRQIKRELAERIRALGRQL